MKHSDSPVSLSFPEFRLPFRSCDDSAAKCRLLMKFILCSLQSLEAYEPRPWPIFGTADLWGPCLYPQQSYLPKTTTCPCRGHFLLLFNLHSFHLLVTLPQFSFEAAVYVRSVAHSCLSLCGPMDCHQAPLSMDFSRQAYWSKLAFPTPGDLPSPGTEPTFLMSPALAGRFFTTIATWEALGVAGGGPDPADHSFHFSDLLIV